MWRLKLIVVSLLAVCIEARSGSFEALELSLIESGGKHPFDILSNYLEKKVLSEDIIANFNATDKLLCRVRRERKPENDCFIRMTTKLLELRSSLVNPNCNEREVNQLFENESNREFDRGSQASAPPRVDRLILNILLDHARICGKVYLERFESRTKADEGASLFIEPAKSMLDKWIQIRKVALAGPEAREIDQKDSLDKLEFKTILELDTLPLGGSLTASEDTAVVIDLIEKEFSTDKLKNLAKLGKNELANELAIVMIEKLIIPCRSFLKLYGDDLFAFAHFDYKWLVTLSDYQPTGGEMELIRALAKFKLCMSLEHGYFRLLGMPAATKLHGKYEDNNNIK